MGETVWEMVQIWQSCSQDGQIWLFLRARRAKYVHFPWEKDRNCSFSLVHGIWYHNDITVWTVFVLTSKAFTRHTWSSNLSPRGRGAVVLMGLGGSPLMLDTYYCNSKSNVAERSNWSRGCPHSLIWNYTERKSILSGKRRFFSS